MYDRVLGLDEFPVKVTLAEHSKQNIYSEVAQLTSKVTLIIVESAFLTGEGCDHDFTEEGNLC